MFTQNKMTAAPVVTTNAHLTLTGGQAAAVVLNSGCANAATGAPGVEDAQAMCAAVAAELGCAAEEVLVCSTGLIGYRLPMDAILAGIPKLVAARSADGGADAAEAMRTTDTHRKETLVAGEGFPSVAWPRARRCWLRTWPRCWPSSRPTRPSIRAS